MKVTDRMINRLLEAMEAHEWVVPNRYSDRTHAEARLFLEVVLREAEEEPQYSPQVSEWLREVHGPWGRDG